MRLPRFLAGTGALLIAWGCATIGTSSTSSVDQTPTTGTRCNPWLTRATEIISLPSDSVSSTTAQQVAYSGAMSDYARCMAGTTMPERTPTERCAPYLDRATAILTALPDTARSATDNQVRYATLMDRYHRCLSSTEDAPLSGLTP